MTVAAAQTANPQPPQVPWRMPALEIAVIAAAVVITVAGLRAASSILAPVVLAIFVAVASLPPLRWLERQRVPRILAIVLVLLLDTAILLSLGWVLLRAAAELRDTLPAYVVRLQMLEASALAQLRAWGVDTYAVRYEEFVQPERLFELAARAVRRLTDVAILSFLILLYVVFMLAESSRLPSKLRSAFGDNMGPAAQLRQIVAEVQRYLALKTLISLLTGVLIGLAAAVLGVDFALFWGLLAFVLNYVPSVGSIIAAIPAVTVAFLQLGPGKAVALAAAYVIVNVIVGNFLDPILVGRRLGLSTLIVLLSLVFWGWLWGIIGMFLAVPLTTAVKIALENSVRYRWMAALLSPGTLPPARAAPT